MVGYCERCYVLELGNFCYLWLGFRTQAIIHDWILDLKFAGVGLQNPAQFDSDSTQDMQELDKFRLETDTYCDW